MNEKAPTSSTKELGVVIIEKHSGMRLIGTATQINTDEDCWFIVSDVYRLTLTEQGNYQLSPLSQNRILWPDGADDLNLLLKSRDVFLITTASTEAEAAWVTTRSRERRYYQPTQQGRKA